MMSFVLVLSAKSLLLYVWTTLPRVTGEVAPWTKWSPLYSDARNSVHSAQSLGRLLG